MKIVPKRKQNKPKKPTQRKRTKEMQRKSMKLKKLMKPKKTKKNTLFNKLSKISYNGYCEASILDDNDKNNDPCHFYDSENKCASETNENDFIRSYKCKWKNK